MNLRRVRSRILPSLIAVATGWAVAVGVTLPMQFAKIAANSTGGPAVLFLSLAEGTLIWGAWSLAIAAGAWLFGLIPVIALVPEDWLSRHPRTSIAVSAVLGLLIVLLRFDIWHVFEPYYTLAVRIFALYALLLVLFSAVSAAVYLRLIARLRALSVNLK